MIERWEYGISEELKELADLFLAEKITKKEFVERASKMPPHPQIIERLKREGKKHDFVCISKVKNLDEEHYIFYVQVISN